MNLNVIAVFNAIDEAKKNSIKFDKSSLESYLRVPVVHRLILERHNGVDGDDLGSV